MATTPVGARGAADLNVRRMGCEAGREARDIVLEVARAHTPSPGVAARGRSLWPVGSSTRAVVDGLRGRGAFAFRAPRTRSLGIPGRGARGAIDRGLVVAAHRALQCHLVVVGLPRYRCGRRRRRRRRRRRAGVNRLRGLCTRIGPCIRLGGSLLQRSCRHGVPIRRGSGRAPRRTTVRARTARARPGARAAVPCDLFRGCSKTVLSTPSASIFCAL